jgi:hypothetical protein
MPDAYLFGLAQRLECCGELSAAKEVLAGIEAPLPQAAAMASRLAAAARISAIAKSSGVTTVALGQNCIADDLANRWGLGALTINGPFSAGVSRGDGASIAIEDDFAAFLDPENFTVTKSASGIQTAMLPKYKILFNHETGSSWLDADVKRLRDYYATRIENFRRSLRQKDLLFVYVRVSPASLLRLWNAVDRAAPASRKKLLVFDFVNPKEVERETLPEEVSVVQMSYPYRSGGEVGEVWHLPQYFNSEIGVKWEKSIIDAMIEEMENLTNASKGFLRRAIGKKKGRASWA